MSKDIIKEAKNEAIIARVKEFGINPELFTREVYFATQIIESSRNNVLKSASSASVLNSVIAIANTGLTLDPIKKHAYLVPYASQCRPAPSYMGLEKLLTDCGAVISINVQLIYENDYFEVDLADTNKPITHKINSLNNRGTIVGCYSIASLTGRIKHVELMPIGEIMYIRNNFSESYKRDPKNSIWTTHEGEMIRKTVVKRHIKHLPKSKYDNRIYEAIELDNQAGGYDEELSFTFMGYIENMILNSNYDYDTQQRLLNQLAEAKYTWQGHEILKKVENDQKDLLENYSKQGGIQDLIRKKVNMSNT